MLAYSGRGKPSHVSTPRRLPRARADTFRGLYSGRDSDLASRLHLRPPKVSLHFASAPSHVHAWLEREFVALQKFTSTPCGSQPAAPVESPSVARLTALRRPFRTGKFFDIPSILSPSLSVYISSLGHDRLASFQLTASASCVESSLPAPEVP